MAESPLLVRWITGFFDVPAEAHDAQAAFWASATSAELSPARGDTGEFATLINPHGDNHLRIQRFEGPARMHLDLHVVDISTAKDGAVALGAEVLEDLGHVVMKSPAGLVFCLVAHDGEHDLGPALQGPHPHRTDQLCIDVPHDAFESEVQFWADLTGRSPRRSEEYPEFVALVDETVR